MFRKKIYFFMVASVNAAEDTSEGAVFQRKGRFKVTSAELSPKVEIHKLKAAQVLVNVKGNPQI